MVTISCTTADGVEHKLVGTEGSSVMEVVTRNGVEGVEAECGGFLSCATCHVYVGQDWVDVVGRAEEKDDDTETELLDGVEAPRRAGSRLSCQIELTAELDGLEISIPDVDR